MPATGSGAWNPWGGGGNDSKPYMSSCCRWSACHNPRMAEPLAEIVKIIIISKINIITDLIELAIELDEAKKFRMGFFFT